jgi:hypothetical protein
MLGGREWNQDGVAFPDEPTFMVAAVAKCLFALYP